MRIPSDLWLGATRNESEASVDDSRCGDQPPGTSDSWTGGREVWVLADASRRPIERAREEQARLHSLQTLAAGALLTEPVRMAESIREVLGRDRGQRRRLAASGIAGHAAHGRKRWGTAAPRSHSAAMLILSQCSPHRGFVRQPLLSRDQIRIRTSCHICARSLMCACSSTRGLLCAIETTTAYRWRSTSAEAHIR